MRNSTHPVNHRIHFRPILSTLLVWLLLGGGATFAQDGFFVPLTASQARLAAPGLEALEKYGIYQLKTTALRGYLAKAPLENRVTAIPLRLAIPLPDGTTETFVMAESPILSPAVAAQHPDIKTYTGTGTTHPGFTIRLSLTSSGFDAIILGVSNSTVYITKVTRDSVDQRYATYFARDVKKNDPVKSFGNLGKCSTPTPQVEALPERAGASARAGAALNNTGTTLRTFRLAVAATKGFTNTKGGKTVQGSFDAVVGYVNRMNAVYRRELSVAFSLVSGTNTIFTDQSDGGYVDGKAGVQASTRNQVVLDNIIKDANYDVGHVLGYSGGFGEGIAAAKSACVTGEKADAYSGVGDGSFAPIFDDQAFNHEVGHQFGMTHTFNSSLGACSTREAKTSVEPGAGTTIMSYGYTCSDEKNPSRTDDYESPYQPFLNFHTVSYQQAVEYISGLSCFTSIPLNNAVPVISNFPSNVTIPRSTPFSLSATATDANASDKLTYSWEGTNIGLEVPMDATLANTAKAPFFRSYEPAPTGSRTYPRLEAILNGSNYARGDKLPSVGVATTHVLTVRDNAGGVTFQGVTVTIDGNSGPFLETTNLSGTHPANSLQTISWNVANTTTPPVSCARVNILLSTDGGQTFPITLLANAPNTGNASIRFPDVRTTQARIKIASSNTVFFDISNANFTIGDPIVLTGAPIVKVNSADPSASEGGSNGGGRLAAPGGRRAAADPGFIQFERSSGQGTLEVNYTIEGTATNGVDFATLPTSIMFAEGQTVVTEELEPLEDNLVEDDETIVITLLDSDAYDPNPDDLTTTITIKDRATSPAPGGAFAITGVTTVSCMPATGEPNRRSLTFTPQYSGTNGQPVSFSVVNEMLTTTAAGPYSLGLYLDNPTITLKATQTGTPGEASFVYNWLAACGASPTTPPPTPTPAPGGAFAITGVTTVSCMPTTGEPNRRSLVFTPQYSGTNSQPVSFSVVNEMLPTTAAGPYSLGIYLDNPTITLKATQSGSPGEASFVYNWLAACGATPTTPTPDPTEVFAIRGVTTVGCTPVAGEPNRRLLTFMPQYSGTNSQPVKFSVYGELDPTTAAGPYSLGLYLDNPTITLKAAQTGTSGEASFVYNWLVNCNTRNVQSKVAREVSAETSLVVRVLGNPITDGRVLVEIEGVSGQPLQLQVTNMRGTVVSSHRIEQSGFLETYTLDIGRQPISTLLLRVATPTQAKTVTLLKTE